MKQLIALLLGLLSLASLTACGPTSDISAPGAAHVDVDTPALRAMREKAEIEPCKASASTTRVKGGLPDVTLPCLGGGEDVSLSGLRGPLVITFWASWCGPCRRELPIYQRFATKYAGRVGVLGIDTNDVHPDAALELARTSGVTFPLVADTETAVAESGMRVVYLPTVAFVDADGALASYQALEITSLKQLEELVTKHLGGDALKPVATAKSSAKKTMKRAS
jgi:thiol-disulfide isomerase/thioredoxin